MVVAQTVLGVVGNLDVEGIDGALDRVVDQSAADVFIAACQLTLVVLVGLDGAAQAGTTALGVAGHEDVLVVCGNVLGQYDAVEVGSNRI